GWDAGAGDAGGRAARGGVRAVRTPGPGRPYGRSPRRGADRRAPRGTAAAGRDGLPGLRRGPFQLAYGGSAGSRRLRRGPWLTPAPARRSSPLVTKTTSSCWL